MPLAIFCGCTARFVSDLVKIKIVSFLRTRLNYHQIPTLSNLLEVADIKRRRVSVKPHLSPNYFVFNDKENSFIDNAIIWSNRTPHGIPIPQNRIF